MTGRRRAITPHLIGMNTNDLKSMMYASKIIIDTVNPDLEQWDYYDNTFPIIDARAMLRVTLNLYYLFIIKEYLRGRGGTDTYINIKHEFIEQRLSTRRLSEVVRIFSKQEGIIIEQNGYVKLV